MALKSGVKVAAALAEMIKRVVAEGQYGVFDIAQIKTGAVTTACQNAVASSGGSPSP